MKVRIELIKSTIAAVEDGATTAKEVGERLGIHTSTVTRHLRLAGLPTVREMAHMTSEERLALKPPEPPKPTRPSRDEAMARLADPELMRKAYHSRKEFGSRAVVCANCNARGVANIKVVGKRGRVLCGDCRRLFQQAS